MQHVYGTCTYIDNEFLNTVVFLDSTKAFATVGHKILLSKLEHDGIQETRWLEL